MILDAENEVEYALRPGLLRHKSSCVCGEGADFGSRSVNVQFDINLATSVTAVRV